MKREPSLLRPLLVCGVLVVLAGPLHAEDAIFSEVRIGVLDHDVHAFGGREHGADFNAELLFASPVPVAAVTFAPSYLRWLLRPRPTIGGSVNTAGDTDKAYLGLTWTAMLATGLLRRDDGLSFGVGFGPSFNDGYINSPVPDRKSLGSNVLFHESLEVSYQITPRYSLGVYYDHDSNAGFARHNQSLNDLGVRFGVRF